MDITPPFRLLDLPAELRIMIYEYTFGDDAPKDLDLINIEEHHPRTDLLQTCQQIRGEALRRYDQATQRFFQGKEFYINITSDGTNQEFMKSLCRRLSRNRLNIQRKITLRFVGLKDLEPDEYVRLTLGLNAEGGGWPTSAEIWNDSGISGDGKERIPLQIMLVGIRFAQMQRQVLRNLIVGEDLLDVRAIMVYLAAIMKLDPVLGSMWKGRRSRRDRG